MKKIGIAAVLLIAIIFFLSGTGNSDDQYFEEIEEYWNDRNDFYKTSQASPFVEKGVVYKKASRFETDVEYKVRGELERFSSRETITLGNSDGTSTTYLKFATVKFKINGAQQSLLILKALGFGTQYLLAFGDDTSGEDTYGGGRYLDVEIGKSDLIDLDFNKSYNPYCAYFADLKCPLPPRENLLDVAVRAGEKNYTH
ncbi:MAG: DUF1684 domain-containing protein [Ekhidna sp.]|nr:DUF1684 domain-containing protein [Ekhidna sp.]